MCYFVNHRLQVQDVAQGSSVQVRCNSEIHTTTAKGPDFIPNRHHMPPCPFLAPSHLHLLQRHREVAIGEVVADVPTQGAELATVLQGRKGGAGRQAERGEGAGRRMGAWSL